MFGSLGGPEIAIIAVVVILLFGVGKLSGLGKDLGGSIKEFRRAMKDEDKDQATVMQAPPQAPQQYAPPAAQQTPPPQQYVAPQQPPVAPAPQGNDKNIF